MDDANHVVPEKGVHEWERISLEDGPRHSHSLARLTVPSGWLYAYDLWERRGNDAFEIKGVAFVPFPPGVTEHAPDGAPGRRGRAVR